MAGKNTTTTKKKLTPFFAFVAVRRPALTKEGKKPTDIAKICGEEWRALSPEQKKKYSS